MTIYRSTERTAIANAALQDARLSLTARGLLALMLSYPDQDLTLAELTNQSEQDDEATIRAALDELEQHGYITAHK